MRRQLLLALPLLLLAPSVPARQQTDFSRLVARLSEPGGFFDSDNLVSNETSYLHAIPALHALGVRGGAYLGVGPEQNFSYIAEIRPELAILVDIRRDNMLLHLLFKAMFQQARNRMEFLCLLFGRAAPADPLAWSDRSLEDVLTYIDITPVDTALQTRTHAALMAQVARFGVPLSDTDRVTLGRFHDEFFYSGLNITFTSRGRGPRPGYPNARQLYLATDLDGAAVSYLATEERFRVVRDLERRDRVVPIVGDLSGPTALRAVSSYLRETGLKVSALYASNVEMYLFRQGNFPKFVENVRALPAAANSVIIRSYFGYGRGMMYGGGTMRDAAAAPLPAPLPGHLSAQSVQTIPTFLSITTNADSVTYFDILSRGVVDLRAPAIKP